MTTYRIQLAAFHPTVRSAASTFYVRYLILLLPALSLIGLCLHLFTSVDLLMRTTQSIPTMNQLDATDPLALEGAAIDFTRLNRVASLDPKYLPGSSSHPHSKDEARKKRLVFIGDIHGCLDELEALLAKVKYTPSHDHIVAVGDVINKGPKSKEVVAFLMEQGASCVRGNHEDAVLAAAHALLGPKDLAPMSEINGEDCENLMQDVKAEKRKMKARETARSLTKEQLRWLQTRPVILQIGEVKPFGNIIAVHAGLVPGLSLEKQDPYAVMNMRIIDVNTNMPSEKHSAEGSALWYNVWHEHEMSLPSHEKHTTVVYGHNKKKGMQIHRFTKGLDTGCVDHGKLTAWVVGFGKDEIVQVKSKQHI